MPALTSAPEIQRHIAEVADGGDRWLLMTDDDRGAALLSGLANGLIQAGVPDARLRYAAFGWLVASTAERAAVGLLTVPVADCPVALIHEVMAAAGYKTADEHTAAQTLVVLSDDPERLAGLIQAAIDGALFPLADPATN